MLVLTVCVQKLLYPLVIAPIGCLQRLGMRHRPATLVHFLILLVLVIVLFFVVPAAVFFTVEMSWSFLDGIYFCFMSLCTVGLGDFVPATYPRQDYRQLYQIGVMGEYGLGPDSQTFWSICAVQRVTRLDVAALEGSAVIKRWNFFLSPCDF